VELNSAYVALTRAIEELYIFIPARVGNTINPAQFLVPEDCLAMGTPAVRPMAHEASQAHQKIKPFVSDPWQGLQEEFLKEPAVSINSARRGEFYHALLMNIGHINEKNFEEVIDKLQVGEDLTILTDIRNFINRQDVRPFFYLPDGSQVFCEKEFVNAYGDTKRIDRLIVFEDKVWVVDYKLSPESKEQHQKQMDGYIELIKQFYPNHKISGHVLYLQQRDQ
jgi:ATP-dependent exoDNAse (exonuclease V) beta subunit